MPASGASPMVVAVAEEARARKDRDALTGEREGEDEERGGRAKEEERETWGGGGEDREAAKERESLRADELFKSRDI